jgi:hypothetical protein
LLQLDPTAHNGGQLKRIAKFIRCNGYQDVLQAAKQTVARVSAATGGSAGPVHDPWAYTLTIANARWVRARDLYVRLGLYEHSLRSHVQALATYYLGDQWWADEVPRFMNPSDWRNMRRNNPGVRLQPPEGPQDIPPMRTFGAADQFVSKLDLDELQAIIRHLWSTVFNQVFQVAPGQPVAYAWLRNSHQRFRDVRNQVMHAQIITKETYEGVSQRLDTILGAVGFDVAKTIARIDSSAPKPMG